MEVDLNAMVSNLNYFRSKISPITKIMAMVLIIQTDVCMDMCMVDISGVKAREGDQEIIFGDGKTIGELAEELGTIPYEVMTSISGRVKRVYFQE